jgi:hypothetical protein
MVPFSITFVEMSPGRPFPPVCMVSIITKGQRERRGEGREREREREREIEEEVVGLQSVRIKGRINR